MEYKGYNGSIEVEGETLTITHSGMIAKTTGLVRDQPRAIPLQAISGVAFKPATRLVNGSITLGLGGAAAADLGSQAAADPNSVMFRHKDKDAFNELHQWLVTVVEHNRSAGVDYTALEFDSTVSTEKQTKQENKMSAMLGDERPDIVAAAARMGWRMGGKRELKNLASHLHEGETVRFIAQGTYEDNQGILVLTDVRLLFLFHGMMSQAKEDFPLRLISSVQTKSGFATGEIKIFVSGNSSSVSGIVKGDLEPLADAVRQGMAAQHAPTQHDARPAAPPPAADDPFEALHKLASLRDAGILTPEEFEAKKKDLMDRM